ncbi:hypothetical protein MNBD_PLANCTO03-522, partial [hydrothermal vent metagenome]
MIFLTPIPAIIAAAVTVPTVLALYFLKLRRRPVRVGSTMLWQQAAEDLQANVPFKWLRPSVVLFVQLLVLAAFLLALARPALHTTGEIPSRVFLVLDRSASMRATDMPGGTTRFAEAIERAEQAVKRITAGGARSEITLIAAAARAEIVAGPTRSTGELLRALEAITPTDQPGDMASALRLVQALAMPEDPEAEDAPRPLVLVYSDGSTGGDLPALAADVRFERIAPEEPGGNIGIVALAARRDHAAPSRVRLFARLQSNLAEPMALGVSVRLDGEVIERQSVEVLPADATGPGETPLALQLETAGGGVLTVTIDRRDVLAADDSASLVIAAPTRPRVLLVRKEESESAGAGWLLTDVLRELELSGLILMSADRLRSLGSEAYAGVDLVIFDGVSVAGGAGGLPPVASMHFGGNPEIPGLVAADGPGRVLPILAWNRSHPLLRDISLGAVRVGKCRVLEPATEEDAVSFTELARTAEGVVLAAIEHGQTMHVVAGFDLVQSTWPVDYSFPIFLANAVESLPRGGDLAAGWSATTAEPVVLAWPVAAEAVLRDPAGKERSVLHAEEGSSAAGRLGVLDRVGVWRLTSRDGEADSRETRFGEPGHRAIPVNLFDAKESSLEAPTVLAVPGGAIMVA